MSGKTQTAEQRFLGALRAGCEASGLAGERLLVAFSGGCDSTALLHGLARLRDALAIRLRAVHVNHGLARDAMSWQGHCVRECERLSVEIIVETVTVTREGRGLEQAARDARYGAFARALERGEVLCTAHHLEDQAETVLLRLLRGSGVAGLGAMRPRRPFETGSLARPLLETPKRVIDEFAQSAGLSWVDDPSNAELSLDRNYLRHRVMPVLHARWPGVASAFARTARNQAQTQRVLDDVAARDLEPLCASSPRRLDVTGLSALAASLQLNVLRAWIGRNGFAMPSRAVLENIHGLAHARCDREPVVRWRDAEVRRYRGELYLGPPLIDVENDPQTQWRVEERLRLTHGELWAERVYGKGVAARWCDRPLALRFRRGGERCRPEGRTHSQSLKRLFQERAVPPWLRSRIPLVYAGSDLICVAGHWVCEGYGTQDRELGWSVHWRDACEQREGGTA